MKENLIELLIYKIQKTIEGKLDCTKIMPGMTRTKSLLLMEELRNMMEISWVVSTSIDLKIQDC